ncbi:MAG: low molecular weight phosphotyrosine protein phosphatase [Gammaproteobacteria bacterium]|nr:low molecular weight phosphotyrosine protein phosphatase [Gammaproteobacteria bacterium]
MIKVLFVCMGNICRSPSAEGVFTQLIKRELLHDKIRVDSAGTHAYHVGDPPDQRAQEAAQRRDIDLSQLRGRKATRADFDEFDYILAMDRDNYADLRAQCSSEQAKKLFLFLDFAPQLKVKDVPDPYYGGPHGFEQVLDLIQAAAEGLLAEICKRLTEKKRS